MSKATYYVVWWEINQYRCKVNWVSWQLFLPARVLLTKNVPDYNCYRFCSLQAATRALHRCNPLQFDSTHTLAASKENCRLRNYLEEKLQLQFGDRYSPAQIHTSVIRVHDNLRRRRRDNQRPAEQQQRRKADAVLTSRRDRLLRKRGRQCQTDEERTSWAKVTAECMSDEETEKRDGETVLVVRAPFWRSQALEEMCHVLQQRATADSRISGPAYRRVMGAVSHRTPSPRCNQELVNADTI